jgi:hypothetical protein
MTILLKLSTRSCLSLIESELLLIVEFFDGIAVYTLTFHVEELLLGTPVMEHHSNSIELKFLEPGTIQISHEVLQSEICDTVRGPWFSEEKVIVRLPTNTGGAELLQM